MTVHDARDLGDLLADELAGRRADGYDVTTFDSDVTAALDEASGPRDPILDTLLSQPQARSAFGSMHGGWALPAHMIDPLENRADSAIAEFAGARIPELADRTPRLVGKVDESRDKRC
jgi:hypothetical protein